MKSLLMVLPETKVRRLSPVQNSGTDFDNIRHYQTTTARLQLVYQQVGPD